MGERDYGRDRGEREWRSEDQDRDYGDRDVRRYGSGSRSDYGRPTSGYGMEGYGPERQRFGGRDDDRDEAARWARERERERERDWRGGSPRGSSQGWGAGGFRGGDWGGSPDRSREPQRSEGREQDWRERGGQGWSGGWQEGGGRSQGSGSWSESGRNYGQYGQSGQYGQPGQYGQSGYGRGYSGRYVPGSSFGGYAGGAMAGAPQSARGERVGRGPRNYKRSDERIREDICETILRYSDIDAGDVEIQVAGSEVTLVGMVEDREDKRHIEDIAQDTLGVSEVHNQLRTRQGNTFKEALQRTGEAIKQFVKGEPLPREQNPREQNAGAPPTASASSSNSPSQR